MATYGDNLTFRAPTSQQVALSDDLVKVIRQHHQKSREHLFHLCMIAYGLRKHNLVKAKSGAGGNAQGRVFKPEFLHWYQVNSLTDVYGSISNFTLYAMAGRLLEYVRWQLGKEYVDHLPWSMTALYALSQIVWSQGDTANDASRNLFKKALTEPTKDGSKHNAFIHPHVSRKEVDEWRAAQITNEKVLPKSKVKSAIKDDPRKIVIATIKVHQDLCKFARSTGRKISGPKMPDVEQLTALLQEVVDKFDAGKARFVLQSHLDEVKAAYESAQNPDFGKKILASQAGKLPQKKVAAKRQRS
jgi:hypothetical protein